MSSKIEKYCEELKKSLDEINKENLIKTACNIKTKDKQLVTEQYQKKYKINLKDNIKKRLNGYLQESLISFFQDPIEYDAEIIYSSLKEQETLIEIATTRSNWIMKKIKKKFFEKYKTDLDEQISSTTLGDYKKLIIGLLKGIRNENCESMEECEEKATDMCDMDYDDWNLNENSLFYEYLTKFSRKQMIIVGGLFNKKAKKNLSKKVDDVFTGEIRKLIQVCLYSLISPSEYFATKLRQALTAASMDYKILMRVFITRNEIDLKKIRMYYKRLYQKELKDDIEVLIQDDVSKLFLEILSKN